MKFLILSILLCGNYCFAQIYPWVDIDTTHYSSSYGGALTRDEFGNLFIAEKNNSGVCIMKYDINHQITWKQKIISTGVSEVGMCTDLLGNVYITSKFSSTLYVGSDSCASGIGGNMFLVKLNPQGIFQWVKQSTGCQAWGFSLSADSQNNIYVAGRVYEGGAYFDSIYLSNNPIIYTYIAKYNTNGTCLWVKGIQPSGFPKIKTDLSGNAYVSSSFFNTALFGSLSVTSYGSQDIYIAKIDSIGKWLWAKQVGGMQQDEPADFDMDAQNDLYLTGFTESSPATFGNITLTNPPGDSYFAAKFDSSGNALWAVSGGAPNGFGGSICADNKGNAYVSTSKSFISKYDSTGKFLWSQYKPAANMDMLADDSGGVYITGYFQNTVSFSNFSFTANYANTNQMFVAKMMDTINSTLGIHPVEHPASSVSVFPNPTSGAFTVRTNEQNPAMQICIYDVLGNCVLPKTSIKNNQQVDLSAQPKGIYFVEMTFGEERKTGKIILE